ncbi:hypothetical protein [Paenibacillus periandrae]|nr:hypothetical protein [Paenibacillus periandrae]
MIHVPMMDNDTSYRHLARANAIGYIQELLNMIERVPNSFE